MKNNILVYIILLIALFNQSIYLKSKGTQRNTSKKIKEKKIIKSISLEDSSNYKELNPDSQNKLKQKAFQMFQILNKIKSQTLSSKKLVKAKKLKRDNKRKKYKNKLKEE